MKTLKEIMENQQKQIQSGKPLKQLDEVKSNEVSLVKTFTSEQKELVTMELGKCLVVQRTWGKQGGDMKATVAIFFEDLKDLGAEEVTIAICEWRKKSPEFPTPSDIRKLIKPEPVFERSVYVGLQAKRKNGEYLTDDDWKYIRKFEANAMKGL